MTSVELFLRWWLEYQSDGILYMVPNSDLYSDYVEWKQCCTDVVHCNNILTFAARLRKLELDGLVYNGKVPGVSSASVTIDKQVLLASLPPNLPRLYYMA